MKRVESNREFKQRHFGETHVTGSEPFSILNCLDTTKFVLPRVFTLRVDFHCRVILRAEVRKIYVRK